MASHFFEHVLVLDTTLCGDFAGPTFASSGCAGTCEQAMANNTNFQCEFSIYPHLPVECAADIHFSFAIVAKWKVNYIAVYE